MLSGEPNEFKEFTEAAPQLAAPDRVIVTTTDLADGAGIGTLMAAIREVNPARDITLSDVRICTPTPCGRTHINRGPDSYLKTPGFNISAIERRSR